MREQLFFVWEGSLAVRKDLVSKLFRNTFVNVLLVC